MVTTTVNVTPMETPIFDSMYPSGVVYTAAMAGRVIALKEEHAALKHRLAAAEGRANDAELMLRAAGDRDLYGWTHSRNISGEHIFEHTRRCRDEDCEAAHIDAHFYLKDDGTGLPILTDEARAALNRAEGG